MASPEELFDRAMMLYAQGDEYVPEANAIIHDLVFGQGDHTQFGHHGRTLDTLVTGLIHHAWESGSEYHRVAVQRAQRLLERELSHVLPDSLLSFALVEHLLQNGGGKAALAVLEQMSLSSEQQVMALRRKASCLEQIGQRDAASQTAWEAVQLDPSDSISHRSYAQILAASGERVPALMAVGYAIALESSPSMVQPMLAEMISYLNLETMSFHDGKMSFSTESILFPGDGGGRLNPEYLFFEMSLGMIIQGIGGGGASRLHIDLVSAVIDSICRYSSIACDEPPEKQADHTESFTFYTRYYASIARAMVVDDFVMHLYRTTPVSEAPYHDHDDRFYARRYARSGEVLPEVEDWRELLDRDDDDDDDDDYDDDPDDSTPRQQYAPNWHADQVPYEPPSAERSASPLWLKVAIPIGVLFALTMLRNCL